MTNTKINIIVSTLLLLIVKVEKYFRVDLRQDGIAHAGNSIDFQAEVTVDQLSNDSNDQLHA